MLSLLALLTIATAAFAQCEPSSTSSSVPTPTGVVSLKPNGDTSKCIDVRGANFANGTPVQIYTCNGTPAQNWVLKRGTGAVQVAGTNFCLDAGSSPASGTGLKIWQCYPGLTQQTWTYGADNSLTLANGQAVDLTNGDKSDGNQLQTWARVSGNTNQVWTTNTVRRRSNRYEGGQ